MGQTVLAITIDDDTKGVNLQLLSGQAEAVQVITALAQIQVSLAQQMGQTVAILNGQVQQLLGAAPAPDPDKVVDIATLRKPGLGDPGLTNNAGGDGDDCVNGQDQ